MPPLNYNPLALTYHQRYATSPLPGVAAHLHTLVEQLGAKQVLEVGCGTGRWLTELGPQVERAIGLDFSPGMLLEARQRDPAVMVTCGEAGQLPFPAATFDLLVCVNALHHFPQPRQFIAEACRVLKPSGVIALVNLDPHAGRDRWYLYDYFDGVYETDLRRFPSSGTLTDWLIAARFDRVEWSVAEHLRGRHLGRAVLDDHFLLKSSSSQLALLAAEAYAAGLARLHADLAEAEAAEQMLSFEAELWFMSVVGYRI